LLALKIAFPAPRVNAKSDREATGPFCLTDVTSRPYRAADRMAGQKFFAADKDF
jgi:hypothetical protein